MNSIFELTRLFLKKTPIFLFFLTISFFTLMLGSSFFNLLTLTNISRQISIDTPIVIGQAIVLISGGIDISVGSVMAMSAAIVIGAQSLGIFLSILLALAFGVFIGCINGLLVTKGKIVPFIATLGTMSAVRGLVLVYTDQKAIMGVLPSFEIIGGGTIGFIPIPFLIALIILMVFHGLLTKMKIGRNFFAVGGDLDNAFLAGVPIFRSRFLPYVISSTLASISGIVLASRLNSANPQIGLDTALASIAAAIIGGASLLGGRGSILGAFLGVATLGTLSTGMNLLGITTYLQIGIKSLVFISVVIIDAVIVKRARKAIKRE
jgi:ribose transport system permease protein